MDLLFNNYPREFGKKRTLIRNYNEMINIIDRYNGVINCFTNIYDINIDSENKREYGVNIDKMFFDLDGDKRGELSWIATKKIHKKLSEEDIRHTVLLSGGGFHVYIFIDSKGIINKKTALCLAQKDIANKCDVTIGDPRNSDIDFHTIGDVARIGRLPNTWNINRRRFCVYLLKDDFNKTFEEVKELGKEPRYKREVFGNKLLDICCYNNKTEKREHINIELLNHSDITINDDILLIQLPPIVRWLLINKRDGHKDRYLTILGCRESGLLIRVTIELCRKYWNSDKFAHALIGHGRNQFVDIYNNQNLFFPTWRYLLDFGYPISKEDLGYELYKGEKVSIEVK